MATIGEMLVRVGLDTKEFNENMKGVKSGLDTMASSLTTIGATMSATITAPLVALGVSSVNAAANLEALTAGLRAVSPTAEDTTRKLAELKEVAKLPGLGFEEAIQGQVRLQAAGLSANLATDALKAFGNAIAIVGGGKAELDGVTLALAQIAAKGKVSAEEINQLAERIPQIREVMRAAFGTADTETLQKMKISATEFITIVTNELLKLPPVASTAKNELENLNDTIKQASAEIGMALLPTVKALTPVLVQLLEQVARGAQEFAKLPQPIQATVIGALALAAALGPILLTTGLMISSISSLLPALSSLSVALKGVSLAGAGVASAWAAVAVAIAAINWPEISAAVRRFNEEIGGVGEAIDIVVKYVEMGFNAALADLADFLSINVEQLKNFFGFLGDVGGALLEGARTIVKYATPLAFMAETINDVTDALNEMKGAVAPANEIVGKLTRSVSDHAKAQADAAMKTMGVTTESVRLRQAQREEEQQKATLQRMTAALNDEHKKAKEKYSEVTTVTRGYSLEMKVLSAEYDRAIDRQRQLEKEYIDFTLASKNATGEIISMADEAAKLNEIVQRGVYENSEWGKAGADAVEKLTTALPKVEAPLEKLKGGFREFGTEVSTIVTNLAQDIGKSLFDGDTSFKEKGIQALKDIGAAAVSQFIQPFLNALTGPEGLITRGINVLLDKLTGVGGVLGGLFGGGASAAGSVAGGVAGGAGSAAGGIAGAGGSAGSTAAGVAMSGAMGWTMAISGVVSAVTDVIGVFQTRNTNDRLWQIEENTRYAMLYLGPKAGGEFNILNQLGYAQEWLSYIRDDLRGPGDNIKVMLADIRGNTHWTLKKIEGWDGWIEGALKSMESSLNTLRMKDWAPTVNVYLDGKLIQQSLGNSMALQNP